ncbi:sigma-70 family RNA polymerase sigma factor [Bhargavaea ullalensis]|uniref:RNA polymerase sigma factor (Sigma-70 family) n=1 Tax=Bhargavaea ullalensis TaxID=1265685 RepID=A0ABV2G9Z7_9BACL
MKTEETLLQYEPMISSMLRLLHIRRDHENFRQAARLALWTALGKYDPSRGHFAPFAHRTIRGAMLDELKKESRYGESFTAVEGETLERLAGWADAPGAEHGDPRMDALRLAVSGLDEAERLFLHRLFELRLSQAEIARLEGISVSGVKKRRERLLRKLRNRMTGCEDHWA